VTLIRSPDNAFFKSLKRLAESARERRKRGCTLLDGAHLLTAYEQKFGSVEALVVAESALASAEIAGLIGGRDKVVITDRLMRDLGLVESPSGLLSLAKLPDGTPAVNHATEAILLDGVQDPGNLGTLLRTAAAVGISQALLSPGCASPWSPKALRAGQGAQFILSIHEDSDLAGFMADFRGTTVVTTLEAAMPLYDACWSEPLAWVFGAEGQGVRPALVAAAQLKVRLPMPGGTESLNVAAAAAVCLYESLRRRSAQVELLQNGG
jgi:TrmH family RNA methyltransferase